MSFKVALYKTPQAKSGRNNELKKEVKAGEPIPLTSNFTIGDALTLSDDGKYIEVGNDVEVVRVTAQLQFAVTDTRCGVAIRKVTNGESMMAGCAYGGGTSYSTNCTVLMNVSQGDQIYVASTSDAVINSTIGGGFRSYLLVEKVM